MGDEDGAAKNFHELGRVAQERGDLIGAETWLKSALTIHERQGNERAAATDHYQLGMVLKARGNFDAAEISYGKALEIEQRQGNDEDAASTLRALSQLQLERA